MKPIFQSCDLNELCHAECHARKNPTGRYSLDKRPDFLQLDLDAKKEVIEFLLKYHRVSIVTCNL